MRDRIAFGNHQSPIVNFQPMATDCSLSITAMMYCWDKSMRYNNKDPNVILVAPDMYHWAEKVVSQLPFELKYLPVIVYRTLPEGHWCIGDLNNKDSFFGSLE